jgi:hypothetical protein
LLGIVGAVFLWSESRVTLSSCPLKRRGEERRREKKRRVGRGGERLYIRCGSRENIFGL